MASYQYIYVMQNLTKVFPGGKELFKGITLSFLPGAKIGVLGVNGAGKSTLLKIMAGIDKEFNGEAWAAEGVKVGYLEQEPKLDPAKNVIENIMDGLGETRDLLKRFEEVSAKFAEPLSDEEMNKLIEEQAELSEKIDACNGWDFERTIEIAMDALRCPPADADVTKLSGGEKRRVALCRLLLQKPDMLLLDEPTNHLDLEAGIWLENRLRQYRGTLLLISHDRNILNSLCDYILHFDHRKLISYSGNYDTFCRTRAMQQELLEKTAEKQERRRRHLQSFVDRFRYKASKARQAQSRLKMLEKLETITLLEDDAVTRFDFPEPLELPPPLLTLEGGVAGYDGKAVLKRLNLQVVDNDRIALLGANGNGKSTLAKVLSGRLPLMEGKLTKSGKLKIGYFAQHQAEELPLELTPVEFMAPKLPDFREPQLRSYLARFGLTQEKALTRIEKLSGGEKARLLFAAMAYNAPEILILDEPTNHLDIDGREALIRALNEYKGSVILIAHDMHLVELVADTLWLVKDGTCKPYDGDLSEYRNLLLQPDKPADKKALPQPEPRQPKGDTRAEKKAAVSRLRRVEREIEKLEEQKKLLEAAFEQPLPTEEIIAKQKDLAWIDNQLNAFEEEWFELSAKLEK